MLHCVLTIGLPSELPEPPGAVEKLVAWISGNRRTPDPHLEALLRANLTVFEQVLRAFEEAGFDDVISVVVDGRPAYLDTEEKIGDLQEALDGTVKSGMLEDGFQILRATFCKRGEGLKLLGEFRCEALEVGGKAEATIRMSARLEDADPHEDEKPKTYATRVRAYIHDAAAVARHRTYVIDEVERLRKAMLVRFTGSQIRRSKVAIRLIAPGMRQVGRMRHLGFGAGMRRTVYCSLPSHERIGPYDDPLTHHYYSPYQDLFHWIAVGEVLAGKWADPWVEVVHPTGRVLTTGDQAASFDRTQLDVDRNAVRVGAEGNLVIDAAVPEIDTLDPSEAGNPHSPGWGGEQWADEADDDAE